MKEVARLAMGVLEAARRDMLMYFSLWSHFGAQGQDLPEEAAETMTRVGGRIDH